MRRTLDKLISWTGLAMAAVLFVAGALLIYASNFVASNVEEQLRPQNITMPSGAALTTQQMKDNLGPYAGQPMTNGSQAKAFADYYIWEHMVEASGGQSYSQVSGKYVAMSKDPNADQEELRKLGELRNTLFMGNTLRGLLLEAYAFGTMGTIALWAGIAAIVAGLVMLALGLLGLRHARTAVDTYEAHSSTRD